MEHYDLPFYKKSSLKWYAHLLFLLGTLTCIVFSIFCFSNLTKDDFIIGLLLGLFMTAVSIYSAYIYVYSTILKRFYIEMTTEYLYVSLPRRNTLIHWSEIYKAHEYVENYNTFIGILLVKDKEKKTKRTVYNILDSMLGAQAISFAIPFDIFGDIDVDMLVTTMEQQINKNKIINGIDI